MDFRYFLLEIMFIARKKKELYKKCRGKINKNSECYNNLINLSEDYDVS